MTRLDPHQGGAGRFLEVLPVSIGLVREIDMRKLQTVTAAAAIGLVLAGSALAQPGPYDQRGNPHDQANPRGNPHDQSYPRGPQGRGPVQGAQSGGQYYYNGRWVDAGEWQRHSSERDSWAHNYQHRRGDHGDDTSAIIAGIIGFALGAAIVGSQQQAEKARTADESWDAYCARKYRTYDRHSRTYMGVDGLRHYCQ
jgi:hypothetical protein